MNRDGCKKTQWFIPEALLAEVRRLSQAGDVSMNFIVTAALRRGMGQPVTTPADKMFEFLVAAAPVVTPVVTPVAPGPPKPSAPAQPCCDDAPLCLHSAPAPLAVVPPPHRTLDDVVKPWPDMNSPELPLDDAYHAVFEERFKQVQEHELNTSDLEAIWRQELHNLRHVPAGDPVRMLQAKMKDEIDRIASGLPF